MNVQATVVFNEAQLPFLEGTEAAMISRVHSGLSGSPKRILIDLIIVDLILATSGLIDKIQRAGTQWLARHC